ncbi:hypothetical protein [Marinicellulosiphila megalodicopiae]|uniref:hypothetical protein n=1 Tax=Marinicellulosiphila megalodicopiae TaxID=2724896 RepID=UPI003BAE2AB6
MQYLNKTGVYFLMFIPAIIIAGLYGSVHDQISFSFSTEYFTHFKFIQFNTPWAQDFPRLGAAVVGAKATWWMGVLVFIVLGLFGFLFDSPKIMAIELFKSFLVVVLVGLITGCLGLIYGYIVVNDQSIEQYQSWIWSDVTHPVQFVRVGFMHNASYLGGLTGLLSAIVYLLFAHKRYTGLK